MFSLYGLRFLERGPFHLKIDRGEIVVISGQSGCGKSMMIHAIANMLDHEVEHLSLNGVERQCVLPHLWRRHLGIVLPQASWWHESVGEHFESKNKTQLAELNLPESAYDWTCKNLSAGEAQRLNFLRTLNNDIQMLFLDEPTANLDLNNTLAFEKCVKKYAQEMRLPVCWISHQREQIERVADQHLIFCKEGLHAIDG